MMILQSSYDIMVITVITIWQNWLYWQAQISYQVSLSHLLFKNIAYIGSKILHILSLLCFMIIWEHNAIAMKNEDNQMTNWYHKRPADSRCKKTHDLCGWNHQKVKNKLGVRCLTTTNIVRYKKTNSCQIIVVWKLGE